MELYGIFEIYTDDEEFMCARLVGYNTIYASKELADRARIRDYGNSFRYETQPMALIYK
jgi:hypothetical protein